MFAVSFLCLLSVLSVLSVDGTSVIRKAQVHAPVLLNKPSSSSIWIVFPSAKTQHLELREQSITENVASSPTADVDSAPTPSADDAQDFFTLHRDLLALHPACQMTLTEERHSPSSTLGKRIHIFLTQNTTHNTNYQYISPLILTSHTHSCAR